MRKTTLGTFPHTVIEIACRYCQQRGRYRRARLIQEYGGGMLLDDFMRFVSRDCRHAEDRTCGRCSGGMC